MQKTPFTATLVCCLAIAATPCTKAPETTPTTATTQNPQGTKPCPPTASMKGIRPLSCFIDNDHRIQVGNGSSTEIPKGTQVFFTAKLENAGAYCANVPAPKPIPPHLYISLPGQPLFDRQGSCRAWLELPPVFEK